MILSEMIYYYRWVCERRRNWPGNTNDNCIISL